MPLTLEIVTPERRVAQTTCDEIRAPGAAGGFGVRPGHAGFMTTLEPGELTVVNGGSQERYAIGGGLLQVDRDQVIVLADTAEPQAEIDVDRAQRAFDEANQRLVSMAADHQNYRNEAARVRRAAARLNVAGGR
jgi:F-type H+-transporting ATPase subunit epsilon